MYNLSKDTKIINIEKSKCKIGHIMHCMSDKNMRGKITFTYDGPIVQKGIMKLHTCKGDCKVKFDAKYMWLRSIEIL